MQDWSQHAVPHGDIVTLDERVWQVTASPPGGPLPRNMTLYRLDDGGLLIHGAHALQSDTMDRLEALGEPRVMILPSAYHSLHEALFRERYPALTVLCPAASREAAAKECRVDGTVEEKLATFGIGWHAPAGLKPLDLAYELPLANGHALLMGDILFNLPHLPGFGGVITRLLGSTGFFGMTRIGRYLMLQDTEAFRLWLHEQANREGLRLILLAHGAPISHKPSWALREASTRL